jgi:hypothetical protein
MNPLLDLPFYWMAQAWPPVWVGGAVLGAVHGLNLTLLALLFNRVTRWPDARSRWGVGLLLLWLSLRGPGFLAELGITMNDNLVSLFVLLPLLLLVRAAGGADRGRGHRVAPRRRPRQGVHGRRTRERGRVAAEGDP